MLRKIAEPEESAKSMDHRLGLIVDLVNNRTNRYIATVEKIPKYFLRKPIILETRYLDYRFRIPILI